MVNKMPKTYEERINQINENIATLYQSIANAKEKIKDLKSKRTIYEKKIEKQNLEELTVFLKKQGIKSIDDIKSLFDDEQDFAENNSNEEN